MQHAKAKAWLCHVLLESLLGNICFNAQLKVSDVIMCMKCLTYFLIWFWMFELFGLYLVWLLLIFVEGLFVLSGGLWFLW